MGTVGVPAAIVSIVLMLVIPLPTILIDLLLVCSILGAIVILLTSMYVKRPLDFSIFPSLLLITTLFRLALNVSTTRLILLHGDAGKVVHSFGSIVVGGSLVVGLVIFFILVVIQFVVITNGSGRVAEVAARFTLDAMPGKQMAIDADLNAGTITEDQARRRREDVAREADFYGAMDGASKFVKGDAIAAIIITIVALLGGFAIGVVQQGLSLSESINRFSLLAVGDGLVSQIPALLISISAGLIVTRAATKNDLGTDIVGQFSHHKPAFRVAAAASLALALLPGIPKLPFLIVGTALFLVSARMIELPTQEEIDEAEAKERALAELPVAPAPDSAEGLAADMRVEPLELEVSFDLVDLVDPSRGGDLLDRVRALRRKLALEMGVVIPLVRTRDNLNLPQGTYTIRVQGVETAVGEAPAGSVLAIGDDLINLPGTPTKEPVFGLAAKWVPIEMRTQAEAIGATVVDRASVITTHLAEVVRTSAGRLIGRQDVKALVDMVKGSDPVVIEELTASGVSLGEVQAVLRMLLDEGVGIRNLVKIFEVISEKAKTNRDPETISEAVRTNLGPAISAAHAIDGRLPVVTVDPLVEHMLLESLRAGDQGTFLSLDPDTAERLVVDIARTSEAAEQSGEQPVLVCSSQIRPALRRLIRSTAPRLAVLSYSELGSQLKLENVGVVKLVDHATI
jgi:flagellar biosynthesis protein FlhA